MFDIMGVQTHKNYTSVAKRDVMIKIGDIIFVQAKGVCKVENIAKNVFDGCDKTKEYYVLKPVDASNNMMIYLPTDTKTKMRALTNKSKIEKLLGAVSQFDTVEISAEEKRFDVYNEIAKRGDFEECLKLLKTLIIRKSKIQKRQFNLQEQKFINSIIASISAEVSYVYSKDCEEIKTQILNHFETLV